MSRTEPWLRSDFPLHANIQTRWNDNDVYGHINNVVYYSYFDTIVNNWLIDKGVLKIGESDFIGLVVKTECEYFAPLSYPHPITAGLRAGRVGRSSVTYELALFSDNSDTAAAQGRFVHVYVDDETRRPIPLPAPMRTLLAQLATHDRQLERPAL